LQHKELKEPPCQNAALVLHKSSGELTQSTDIEYLLNAPLLPSHKLYVDTRPKFRPVPTVCVVVLLLLIQHVHTNCQFPID
ncbi:unnamed protein product, partial [Ranitomeya imitator]